MFVRGMHKFNMEETDATLRSMARYTATMCDRLEVSLRRRPIDTSALEFAYEFVPWAYEVWSNEVRETHGPPVLVHLGSLEAEILRVQEVLATTPTFSGETITAVDAVGITTTVKTYNWGDLIGVCKVDGEFVDITLRRPSPRIRVKGDIALVLEHYPIMK